MKTAKQVLIDAKALIQDEAHWAQGGFYKTDAGTDCSQGVACKFCAVGALRKAAGVSDYYESIDCIPMQQAIDFLAKGMGTANGGGIVDFNDADTRKHAEVLAAFDSAIKECDK